MALVACKECGMQVREDAKKCTKCGAKMPRKRPIGTWLFAIFAAIAIYFVLQLPKPAAKITSAKIASIVPTETNKSLPVKPTPPPKPAWSTRTSSDQMTGEFSAYASSPISFPTEVMSFPYSDVRAWLGIGCKGQREWAYIGFSASPNLANTSTEDGYSLIYTRIRWNDVVENIKLRQDWGSDFIHFTDYASTIRKIDSSKTALLELQWYGQQQTYFEFSLNGSSKALEEIRSKCKAS